MTAQNVKQRKQQKVEFLRVFILFYWCLHKTDHTDMEIPQCGLDVSQSACLTEPQMKKKTNVTRWWKRREFFFKNRNVKENFK